MILLRRLNGSPFGVNADLIERIEITPDTVITLVDGTKYVVADSCDDVIDRIIEFRARILADAERLADADPNPRAVSPPLRLVAEPGEEV
ncbi:MAG TPA: flagellar FlbD family protein [Acidimicrobiales bacterium]|nr:flagellar FlbD family protein [Acidimicrobiales bacterium]